MDFELNEEQRLLKDSVERLLADHYEFEARKTYMEAPEGFGRELWAKYAELGLLGLPFEERFGGFGGGPVETMMVGEALGRGVGVETFLARVVVGGGLVGHGGRDEEGGGLVAKIGDGRLLLALVEREGQWGY